MEKMSYWLIPVGAKEVVIVMLMVAAIISVAMTYKETPAPVVEIGCSLPQKEGFAVVRSHYRRVGG